MNELKSLAGLISVQRQKAFADNVCSFLFSVSNVLPDDKYSSAADISLQWSGSMEHFAEKYILNTLNSLLPALQTDHKPNVLRVICGH